MSSRIYKIFFTDLGFNVDLVIRKKGFDSMLKFEPKDKIRLFQFHNLKEINRRLFYFKQTIRKYNYSLLHSTNGTKKKNLDIFEN